MARRFVHLVITIDAPFYFACDLCMSCYAMLFYAMLYCSVNAL